MTVEYEIRDSIAVITLNNPPVNALGQASRAGFIEAFDRVEQDMSLIGVIITGGGRLFCCGADIKEFHQKAQAPHLPDVIARIDACTLPTIAAINGVALGGGLEIALACRQRISVPEAKLGLPEVNLGLIPGAGGTQRLPRLVGMKRAAEMICSGKPITASQALEDGLVDAMVEGEYLLSMATNLLTAGESRPAVSSLCVPADWDAVWLNDFSEEIIQKLRGKIAPLKALEAISCVGTMPFSEGLKQERKIFLELRDGEQRAALVHNFLAERAANNPSELQGVEPYKVRKIAILGAGIMGAGIATAALIAGFEVLLFDRQKEALQSGHKRVLFNLDQAESRGKLNNAQAKNAKGALQRINDLDGLADADLFIEAIVEKMEAKQALFKALDKIAKPDAVLASNTSYLNINEIGAVTARPQNVVGMHFFSPANIMRLLEIIRTDKSSKSALATAFSVGKAMGKVSVICGVCDGFIGNRILKKYREQADFMIEEGAMPWDIDAAMRAYGFAMGPFQVSDLAGIDIGWHNRRREDATRDHDARYVNIADKLYELGRLGQKTGAGYYLYKEGDRAGHPDPLVEKLVLDNSAAKGIERRVISVDEICERILSAMLSEGRQILKEGVAASSADIDLVFINGYGFPAHRGGPMFYGEQQE